MKSLGICLGAASLSAVELVRANGRFTVGLTLRESHEGSPRASLERLRQRLALASYDRIGITGRKLRHLLNLSSITEVEASERALAYVAAGSDRRIAAVASIGAETFIVYSVGTDGSIAEIHSENKCASGTGELFEQMLRRMDLTTDTALKIAAGVAPHPVSGRCSVFCKSDCTHALNVGHSRGALTAGLCKMMAEKIARLLRQARAKQRARGMRAGENGDGYGHGNGDGPGNGSGNGHGNGHGNGNEDRILLVGGLTLNPVLIEFLRELVPEVVVCQQSPYFEALGAAVWASENATMPYPGPERFFVGSVPSYGRLAPLAEARDRVRFHDRPRARVTPEGEYLLGVDVGSTTTKAVLMRKSDRAVVASEYLRTHGDPVGAARRCYASLREQFGDGLPIVGLGVTGSGRHIAGLHAKTRGIINEIIAHAAAAAHFDPGVDTIFEIGGQDAKYTYLVNGVPCDYAMNEACSAGTGSFLEESAKGTLGLEVEEIETLALAAQAPADFSDQCAAFIASDLKNAIHEGFERADMVAGLVYSVCVNYNNKVRSSRPIGNKVFMQGGVCYNRAVPVAMAAITGKEIIVPPEPGLAGAFGVALEVAKRLDLGLLERGSFSLAELVAREVGYERTFVCSGGAHHCDLGCTIQMTVVDGQTIPFGGRCDRYYNRRLRKKVDSHGLNLVRARQQLVFEEFAHPFAADDDRPTVGMNRSFFLHTYYPLFSHFFAELGFRLVLPEQADPEGIGRKASSFCYPAELAHGYFLDLLRRDPDHVVLVQVTETPVPGRRPTAREQQSVCVTAQAEPYYLRSAFKDVPRRARMHTAVVNLAPGLAGAQGAMVALARELGVGPKRAKRAFEQAMARQEACEEAMRSAGRAALARLAEDPARGAVVVFGRSYNAFTTDANMAIPNKLASRGWLTIPFDFLPLADEPCDPWMHWGSGHNLIRAARVVARHPQLFGAWITNFSCGPDSFLVGWFREAMGSKPSLTLEIDGHTADAGINTRIDAFLDVVEQYRVVDRAGQGRAAAAPFAGTRLRVGARGNGSSPTVVTEDGTELALRDPRVRVVLPPMGDLAAEMLAAVFRGEGTHATPLPVPTAHTLQTGRGCTSCKECLPLTLSAGSMLEHVQQRPADEVTVMFMPRSEGNCRFGQYAPFLQNLITKRRIPRLGILSLSSQDNYAGMGQPFARRTLNAVILSDAMRDIRNAVRTLAVDREQGLRIFGEEWRRLCDTVASGSETEMEEAARVTARNLARIPLTRRYADAKKVLLVGEVYVRSDEFSCNWIGERLADRGLIMKTATVFEWLRYVEWLCRRGIIGNGNHTGLRARLEAFLVSRFEAKRERILKEILAGSGLCDDERLDVGRIIEAGRRFVDQRLTGEAILVTGAALREILHAVCGVISIGPFACLPSRVCEALLATEFTLDNKRRCDGRLEERYAKLEGLPYLAIEADGRPFPPLIEARLEAFILQAGRLGDLMLGRAAAHASRA